MVDTAPDTHVAAGGSSQSGSGVTRATRRRRITQGAIAATGAGLAYVSPIAQRVVHGQQAGSPPPVGPQPTPIGTPQACNTASSSGGPGVTVTVHELGQSSGTFGFQYEAFGVPDLFEIFLGSGTGGAVLFTTTNPVSGNNSVNVAYSGSSQITVRVTGPSGTLWEYTVQCPNGTAITSRS